MGQNQTQWSATGTLGNGTTQDVTTLASWTVSDSSIVTVGAANGQVTIQSAGKIWGADVGVTATYTNVIGTGTIMCIASDSGTIAPRMPQQDNHWQALGLSPWGTYFGLQEASGSMSVGSGSYQFALTASTNAGIGPSYQSAEPGWLRNFIVMTGSGGDMNLGWPSNFGPSTSSSFAMLCYAHLGMLGGTNLGVMGILGASTTSFRMSTDQFTANTGQAGVNFSGITDNLCGPITQIVSDRVHPWLLVYNTSSLQTLAATDVSIATSASSLDNFTAVNNTVRGIGGVTAGATAASASYCYFAVCTGSVAEYLSDIQHAGNFLTALGWNVHWLNCPTDSGSIKLPFLPHHWEGLGIVPWTATWNMQDAAGQLCTDNYWPGKNLNGWNLTNSAIDAYRYNIAAGYSQGWSRSGIMLTTVASHNARVVANFAHAPDMNFDPTGSFACLLYGAFIVPSVGGRPVMGLANSANHAVICEAWGSTSGFPMIDCAAASTTGTQNVCDGKVHPWLFVYDKTNSRVKLYTDLEKITGSFNATTLQNSVTASFGFGGQTNPATSAPLSGVYIYGAFTTGTLAESYSDDGAASNFLKTMGWTIPW